PNSFKFSSASIRPTNIPASVLDWPLSQKRLNEWVAVLALNPSQRKAVASGSNCQLLGNSADPNFSELVEIQPPAFEPLGHLDALPGPDRLDDKGISAKLISPLNIFWLMGRGEHDDDKRLESRLRADPFQYLQP